VHEEERKQNRKFARPQIEEAKSAWNGREIRGRRRVGLRIHSHGKQVYSEILAGKKKK
jgi:hypothetical protein